MLLGAAVRWQSPASREQAWSGLPIARAAHHSGHLLVMLPLAWLHASVVLPVLAQLHTSKAIRYPRLRLTSPSVKLIVLHNTA